MAGGGLEYGLRIGADSELPRPGAAIDCAAPLAMSTSSPPVAQPPPDSPRSPAQPASQSFAAPAEAGASEEREEFLPPPAARRASSSAHYTEKCGISGKRWRVFTAEEVRRHNTPSDCWLIAHGRVYDVTSFLRRHPAGDQSILRHAGTDSTIDFDFHPQHAQKMWAPYQIGYVEGQQSSCTIS